MVVNDYIAEFLYCQNVRHVFEMAGGMITHLLDAIHNAGKINIISVHHEQSAAFAVDAYARCSGNVGAAFATSGPGATNLITGIASCYFDSSPAIFITGQVNMHELKGCKQIRQLGFQETDIVSMVSGITKKCYQITNADDVERIFQEAYLIAISDRPGPVLIDLPMNLQKKQIDVNPIKKINRNKNTKKIEADIFKQIIAAMQQAKRPLILAGRGVSAACATKKFINLIEKLQIPVVTSLLGIDLIPFDHSLRVGFIGSYGNRWANLAIGNSDLLIVLGSRLDIRQTGADTDAFAKDKTIFHVDCNEHEINNRLKNCIPIIADVEDFIEQMHLAVQSINIPIKFSWLNEINELRRQWPDTNEIMDISGINPNVFMHALSSTCRAAVGYVVDVGNHQMWAAQSIEVMKNQFFITSGGMGAMGFALPAAIGASLANENKSVVIIAGDGGFQLNIQELQTIIRNKLPIKIVVINNNCLGMIRQFQDNYFAGRYQSTYWGYTAPDFAAIATAYGLSAKTISLSNEVEEGANWLWENDKAALLQVMVNAHANAYPKIAFGRPITEMEPFAEPLCMEGT